MKKTILAILLALLMVFSVALVACTPPDDGGGEDKPDPVDPPVETPEVPVEEGKVTFYFTLDSGSVEQLDITSYFMTGGIMDDGAGAWIVGAGSLEFAQLEGTDVYYVVTDKIPNPAADKGLDYQLLVGYNETSGMTGDGLGVVWNNERKSDQCLAFTGLDNPSFEYAAGDQTVDLGTHKFSTALAVPKKIDVVLRVNFEVALPENYSIRIVGSLNGWDGAWTPETDNLYSMVVSEDRMYATIDFKDALLGEYEYQVIVYTDKQIITAKDQIWSGAAFGKVGNDNGKFTLESLDAGEEIAILGGIAIYAPVDFTFQVTFAEALAEGSIVHVYGNFQGWGPAGICEMSSTDGKVYTLALTGVTPGNLEFKVAVFPAGTPEFGWGIGTEYGAEGGANFSAVLAPDAGGTIVNTDINNAAA
jgi:hypothetical protein